MVYLINFFVILHYIYKAWTEKPWCSSCFDSWKRFLAISSGDTLCFSFYPISQAWALYEKGTLVHLVDATLEGDPNIDEACKYLKIALLCTQVNPKNRPSMSTVVKMLRGEAEVEEGELSKPGLLTELGHPSNKPRGSSSSTGTSSTSNTNVSHGTMTFASIYDRSNWVE